MAIHLVAVLLATSLLTACADSAPDQRPADRADYSDILTDSARLAVDGGEMTPDARVVVIPDAAHITAWDNPEADVAAVRAFLRAVDAGR
jgi:pimeloyl-ACP methyl ester carboxylesterase